MSAIHFSNKIIGILIIISKKKLVSLNCAVTVLLFILIELVLYLCLLLFMQESMMTKVQVELEQILANKQLEVNSHITIIYQLPVNYIYLHQGWVTARNRGNRRKKRNVLV